MISARLEFDLPRFFGAVAVRIGGDGVMNFVAVEVLDDLFARFILRQRQRPENPERGACHGEKYNCQKARDKPSAENTTIRHRIYSHRSPKR